MVLSVVCWTFLLVDLSIGDPLAHVQYLRRQGIIIEPADLYFLYQSHLFGEAKLVIINASFPKITSQATKDCIFVTMTDVVVLPI